MRDNFVLCISLKAHVEFQNSKNMAKFRGFGDCPSCRVQDKLKTVDVRCQKPHKITTVNFQMNNSSENYV